MSYSSILQSLQQLFLNGIVNSSSNKGLFFTPLYAQGPPALPTHLPPSSTEHTPVYHNHIKSQEIKTPQINS
ncbi:hypothetical protein E2C01_039032 [Portunus trituberculatus]|uniref:Uncharacterized protein n=1 Tax=Portunus trituberculatus TaxID=210409 RepID=A0A5B7FLM7_PORTR|nr:hypothetical protein [Portunus trituberculatus]